MELDTGLAQNEKEITQSGVIEPPKDLKINCKTCQKEFVWGVREQNYYKKRGLLKKPQKCQSCREKANKLRDNSMFYIHCGLCEKDGVSLAPPPKDRVAICESCYRKLADQAKPKVSEDAS